MDESCLFYARYQADITCVCALQVSSDNENVTLLQEFVELQNQYAVLQHKMSAPGLTKGTLGKVKQLKDTAAKLAGDTEDKMRRIAGTYSLYVPSFFEV